VNEPTTYEILKDFAGPLATLVGAIIGLSVVAWQTRRGFRNLIASQEHRAAIERDARADQARIQREIAAEQLDREKMALAAALTGELFSLWHQIEDATIIPKAQSIMLAGAQGTREAMLPIFRIRVPIYEANISKLGLLGSSLAGDVARVFSRATISSSTSPDEQKTPRMDVKIYKAIIDGFVQSNSEWLEDISYVIKRLSALERGTSDDPGPLYLLEQERERKRKTQPTQQAADPGAVVARKHHNRRARPRWRRSQRAGERRAPHDDARHRSRCDRWCAPP
jgi:hypothetical protein